MTKPLDTVEEIDKFFLSGKDITLYTAKKFITKLIAKERNKWINELFSHNTVDGCVSVDGIFEDLVSQFKQDKSVQDNKPITQ